MGFSLDFFLEMWGLQLILAWAALALIMALDDSHGLRTDTAVGILLAGSAVGAGYITCLCGGHPPGTRLGYLALTVYLTVCSVTDMQTCRVYDLLQIPTAVSGSWLCLVRPVDAESGVGLVVFALLQYLLFRRMYGEGDVMAFQICALYLAAAGGDLLTMLLHMALTFGLLGVVQLMRGNIGRKGDLITPVPLFPYIACSVLCFL